MRTSRGRLGSYLIILSVIFARGLSSAQADPITSQGYTITDLGAGSPTFSTGANGNGIVIGPNGQAYAFEQAPSTFQNPGQGILANFPLFQPAPVNDSNAYGNPLNAFSNVSVLGPNANGIAVAVDSFGVNGHLYNDEVYYVQHNADGSWGQPIGVWSGPAQFQNGAGNYWGFQVVGLSSTNEILISNPSSNFETNAALLYNVNTHTLTDLFTLLNSANDLHYNVVPVAISTDGQILVEAESGTTNLDPMHTLLLTPDGVSAEPLVSPVPEPGALSVMVLAIAGFAAHRLRERRRNST